MSEATSPGRYIIPHHAVYHPEIDPNKIRVVFDASARGFRGQSLNECLWSGPKLQQDIVDVLKRFRVHKYTFTTDICKMYRQILTLPKYREFQHVLWRSSPHDELREYELNTVTYGVNCAPYLALRVLKVIASTDCDGFDRVRNALNYQTYVDDICVGADTIPDVLKLQSDLISVLGRSGLELKKWASNTPAVLQAVPAADCVGAPMTFGDDNGYGTKVLGLAWHPDCDYFCCALSLEPSPVFTKRGILSLVARIFDPPHIFVVDRILGDSPLLIFYKTCIMASKNILQDDEIEDLLFLTPPEGSEDELEDFNIDELVCENYDTDTYDHNDDNVDIIDLPDVDQNIFIPNNDLDSIELENPIVIVVPNSESLNLRQPLVNSTTTSEVSVVHTPTVEKINTPKRTKFREIKSVIWKKRPFQISPDEIKFKGDTSLPQDPFFDLESPLDFFNYFFSSDLIKHICEESLRGQPGHDRLFRIRTVLETLKKRFQTVPLEESLSVDEQLCATKGRHFMKQYMPMKSHKWGYKLFILACVSGFAYNIEIYSGQENDPQYRLTNEPDLGASANIVVRLCSISNCK
ncbi:hypothetical protein QTP88_007728 [Uroleucon formosanum]